MIRAGLLATALCLLSQGAAAACSEGVAGLRWPDGSASFTVEIADDAAERAQGLMFRESLDPSAGMLFIYERPQPAAFWMKNTLIPLDILFFDASGRLTAVHENAVPHDETPLPGGDAVAMVLEIPGGRARELGLSGAVELQHPRLPNPVWPCE
ncbi:DUF192 domain-containing protein [Frigidibacter albus]|uniref:DUF192 domain-containing protein n=1 Tax=Frigidibacter albus TaxID=1465486 RepID=A0A6L8VL82_9RHOB|nr:DUF192 domain-containing protein [Frigidibacter albus]MZQ89920.1 DUF192 domain-containing protein [Frigidibacter albus]NBE31705.1 DUF192 domain-containing protein [Frigidibacter albus]GGH55986.1 hypothetical protein GCM10011341_24020 [Frigidibacter albus]